MGTTAAGGRGVAPAADGRGPYPHEIVTAAYLALTAALVLALGRPPARWAPIVLAHALSVAALVWVLPRVATRGALAVARDWLPVVALPFLYAELARLNDLWGGGYHDAAIQSVEAVIFGGQPSTTLRLLLPWRPLGEYLHFGYFGYYALLPGLGLALYGTGRRDAFRLMLTTVLLVFLACYLCFVVLPVAGPWYVYPRPSPESVGWVFPGVVHRVLAWGSSQGTAFPSSHVAVAVVTWMLAWRLARPVFRAYALIVPALVVGTVYGGFHYAVDSVAGTAIGLAGYAIGPRLHASLTLRGGPRRAREVRGGGDHDPDLPST
ncbi:MAG: phosphatase PAP2 family protein [Gemmatimonadaceae bacterium]